MGGIPTNYKAEVVTLANNNPDSIVPGLMAIGEAACVSVHGANRLGSNSLLDLVVFGRSAAIRCAELIRPNQPHRSLKKDACATALARFDKIRFAKGSLASADIRLAMQRTMQTNAAVFRSQDTLSAGKHDINLIKQSFNDLKMNDSSLIWNTELVEALELDNLLAQAQVTLHAAENRQESRGGHAREDFPKRDDVNWMKHTLTWQTEENVHIDYRPVHMFTLSNDVDVIPPKERVY